MTLNCKNRLNIYMYSRASKIVVMCCLHHLRECQVKWAQLKPVKLKSCEYVGLREQENCDTAKYNLNRGDCVMYLKLDPLVGHLSVYVSRTWGVFLGSTLTTTWSRGQGRALPASKMVPVWCSLSTTSPMPWSTTSWSATSQRCVNARNMLTRKTDVELLILNDVCLLLCVCVCV